MKKLKLYIGLIALAIVGAGLTSCSEDYAQPPIVIPESDGLIGDGTWENPLQAWQAAKGTMPGDRTSNWVTGYIVGWVDTSVGNTMNENSFVIGIPCNVNTNMVIAQYPYDAEEWKKMDYTWKDCVSVQLPSGHVRTALNLMDNPDNFNKQVSLRGTTGSKYCGVYGVRSVADFNWGDKGKYEEPITPIGSSYYCNFDISADINYYIERGWKNTAVSGGLSGWYVKNNSGQQFATVSAYLGSANSGPYENWLISPGIDIDKADEKTVSFITQAGYQAQNCTLEVFVMTKATPRECEPVKLGAVIAQAPASGFSAWTESGLIDLSEFSGKIYIGFRYYAAAGGQNNSTEFHVDNFNLGGAEVPVDPNKPVLDPILEHTFVKAAEVKSGKKYAMVHGTQYATPIQEGYSYGYLVGADFQFVTPDSFITTNLNAFTFEKEDEGYTIRDYYGRYLYLDATHTSFQISEQKPTANYLWKVEYSGGHFNISNVGRGNFIEWADKFSNFSTVVATGYAQQGPELFEMAD